jgi:hypothetical protein
VLRETAFDVLPTNNPTQKSIISIVTTTLASSLQNGRQGETHELDLVNVAAGVGLESRQDLVVFAPPQCSQHAHTRQFLPQLTWAVKRA